MSTINWYILRQAAAPLLIAILVALLMLLTERMLRLLDTVLDSSGSVHILIEMLAFLVPHYVALALPIAFFLGVLLAFSGMHQRNEINALLSAGIGLHTLLRPVLALAVFLTLLSLLNTALIQPHARYLYRSLVHDLSATAATAFLQNGVFLEVDGYTFMAENIGRDHSFFSNVFIYEVGEAGGSRVITAKEGRIVPTSKKGESILQLVGGEAIRIQSRSPSKKTQAGGDSDIVTFGKLEVPINLGAALPFRIRGIDERELTLVELWSRRNFPPSSATTKEMLAEFNDRLVRIVSVFFLPFLAIGFAIAPPRTHRAYNTGIGVLIVIIYNEVVRVGKISSADGLLPIAVAQWLPFLLFAIFSLTIFCRQAFGMTRTSGLNRIITRLEDNRRVFWSRFSFVRR
ncbi:MAG: LptF/LptG family permease [Proteobacteria bacterium]|nr:LptF/LptG family permease [Pseudomonadota bacterium]